MTLDFIVDRRLNGTQSIHLWKLGEELPEPVWTQSIEHDHRYPNFSSPLLLVEDRLFIGLVSGHIVEIDVNSGEEEVCYGPREIVGIEGEESAPVSHLALCNGKVYDGSAEGLFDTTRDVSIDDRIIGGIEVIDGKLYIIPHGLNPRLLKNCPPGMSAFAYSIKESNAQHLVDIESGEVVMKHVHPFDGSGYSPGTHFVHDDKIYIHHGDWPDEKITIRSFPDGKIVQQVRVPTSSHFTAHDGRVYDFRHGGSAPKQVLPSDEDYDGATRSLFDVPEGTNVLSMASAGERGLLIATYNGAKGKVVSHHSPNKPLLELPGSLYLRRI